MLMRTKRNGQGSIFAPPRALLLKSSRLFGLCSKPVSNIRFIGLYVSLPA
jgi:hypothetical protein